jgi:hypothetical protein
MGVSSAPVSAQEEEAEDLPITVPETESPSDQPIAVELAGGIDLLNDQIAQQQTLLATASSEREQELIRNHIRLLEKERRTLKSLLNKLVGPNFDARQAAQEQQAEHRAEQYERTLEKDERQSQP